MFSKQITHVFLASFPSQHGFNFIHLNINLDKQAKHSTPEEIGYVLCLEHCLIWLRDLGTKKIGVEVFGELCNVVLEEKGKNKMVRGSN
jgi:hypothetical protein